MRSLRTLLVSGAVTALAITALGAPVGAADTKGTLAIVNGIPGKRVDVCLNGNEIASGLKYGGKVFKNVVPTGNKNLKFFKRDPRTCRGNLLAQEQFPLAAAEDLTIVATKNDPEVVIFSNAGFGEIPPLGPPLGFGVFAWRSAADLATNFKYTFWAPDASDVPIGPTVDPLWVKGDQLASATTTDWIWALRATLPDSPDSIAGPKRVVTRNGHRYEWILIGTHPNNTRFVLLDRAISAPSP